MHLDALRLYLPTNIFVWHCLTIGRFLRCKTNTQLTGEESSQACSACRILRLGRDSWVWTHTQEASATNSFMILGHHNTCMAGTEAKRPARQHPPCSGIAVGASGATPMHWGRPLDKGECSNQNETHNGSLETCTKCHEIWNVAF